MTGEPRLLRWNAFLYTALIDDLMPMPALGGCCEGLGVDAAADDEGGWGGVVMAEGGGGGYC